MSASGMQVWVGKRARKGAGANALSGYGLVLGLNVGVVAGMPLASVAMLLANRLLPAPLPDREAAEVTVFCTVWALAAAWGAWRTWRGVGWRATFRSVALRVGAECGSKCVRRLSACL